MCGAAASQRGGILTVLLLAGYVCVFFCLSVCLCGVSGLPVPLLAETAQVSADGVLPGNPLSLLQEGRINPGVEAVVIGTMMNESLAFAPWKILGGLKGLEAEAFLDLFLDVRHPPTHLLRSSSSCCCCSLLRRPSFFLQNSLSCFEKHTLLALNASQFSSANCLFDDPGAIRGRAARWVESFVCRNEHFTRDAGNYNVDRLLIHMLLQRCGA